MLITKVEIRTARGRYKLLCVSVKKKKNRTKNDMDSIIEKSRNINKNFTEDIIEFYHENQSDFDNFDNINEIETIEEIILIKQKYCEALESKAHYKELTVVLKHIFILLTKIKSKSQKHDSYYERALFYEGIVLGRQEKYSQSNHRFKELLIIDPINETYKNWYQSNKEKKFENIKSSLEGIVTFITVFITLLGSYIFGKTYTTILIIGFVLFIGTFVYTRVNRKKTT